MCEVGVQGHPQGKPRRAAWPRGLSTALPVLRGRCAPCPAQPYRTPRALALPYQELPGYPLVFSSTEKTSRRPDGQHGPALGSAWGLAAQPASGGSAVPGHLQACIVAVWGGCGHMPGWTDYVSVHRQSLDFYTCKALSKIRDELEHALFYNREAVNLF